jgi:hypothetical protein
MCIVFFVLGMIAGDMAQRAAWAFGRWLARKARGSGRVRVKWE